MKKVLRRVRAVEKKCDRILNELRILRLTRTRRTDSCRSLEESARVLRDMSRRELERWDDEL